MQIPSELKRIILQSGKINPKWRRVLTPEQHEIVNTLLTAHCVSSPGELLWIINYGRSICESCGGNTEFRANSGHKRFCSKKCSANSESTKQRRYQTNKQKYGVEFPQQLTNQKDRAKNTVFEKYGDNPPHFFGGPLFKKRMLELFGVENPGQAEELRGSNKKNLRFIERMLPLLREKNLTVIGDLTSNEPTLIRHSCGHEFERRVWACQVPRCPKCFPVQLSTQHLMVRDWLQKHNIYFEENDRKILAPKELDFFLPSHKLALEVNGLYWHSEAGGTMKGYHQWKTIECLKQGITLIHLYEDELSLKFDETMERVRENYLDVKEDIEITGALLVNGNWPLPQQFSVAVVEIFEPEQYVILEKFRHKLSSPVWDAGKLVYVSNQKPN